MTAIALVSVVAGAVALALAGLAFYWSWLGKRHLQGRPPARYWLPGGPYTVKPAPAEQCDPVCDRPPGHPGLHVWQMVPDAEIRVCTGTANDEGGRAVLLAVTVSDLHAAYRYGDAGDGLPVDVLAAIIGGKFVSVLFAPAPLVDQLPAVRL